MKIAKKIASVLYGFVMAIAVSSLTVAVIANNAALTYGNIDKRTDMYGFVAGLRDICFYIGIGAVLLILIYNIFRWIKNKWDRMDDDQRKRILSQTQKMMTYFAGFAGIAIVLVAATTLIVFWFECVCNAVSWEKGMHSTAKYMESLWVAFEYAGYGAIGLMLIYGPSLEIFKKYGLEPGFLKKNTQ